MRVCPRLGKHRSIATPTRGRNSQARSENSSRAISFRSGLLLCRHIFPRRQPPLATDLECRRTRYRPPEGLQGIPPPCLLLNLHQGSRSLGELALLADLQTLFPVTDRGIADLQGAATEPRDKATGGGPPQREWRQTS